MKFQRFLPLFVLIIVAALGAAALVIGRSLDLRDWMSVFMGLLLCQFSMLKLFNRSQFVEGFKKYDWIAKRSCLYASIYPFLELGLGLAYLAQIEPLIVNLVLLVMTGIGALGVLQALKAGLDVRCACMGTVLDVPLSTVTLTEDIGMGAMALIMLLYQ